MKNKAIVKRNRVLAGIIISFSLILSILVTMPFADVSAKSSRYTADDLERVIDGIISYKQGEAKASPEAGAFSVQEFIDTGLAKKAGTSPAEWYIIALNRYKDRYEYGNYLQSLDSYVKDKNPTKAADLERIALAYTFCDSNEKFVKKAIKASIGESGIMSYIYGLILIDTRAYPSDEISREDIIKKLLSLRLEDGGWALTGTASDVDVTAMAIQALAPYYEETAVKTAVDGALELLSEKQQKTGDYKSYGVRNCESVAQVITALSALDIDFQTEERFIKDKKTLLDGLMLYSRSDGSFSHIIDGSSNDMASAQAMYSLISAWRQSKGLAPFYIINETDAADRASVSLIPEEGFPSEDDSNSAVKKNTSSEDSSNPAVEKDIMISIFLIIAMLIGMGTLAVRKKLNRKNILFLVAITGLAALILWGVNIQTVEEYYSVNSETVAPDSETVTVSIRCDTVAGRQGSAAIPADGVVLASTEYAMKEGDSVFDVLVRAVKQNKIQLDYQGADTDSSGTVYVKGMNHLYEYDFGELSGWMYQVNGEFPSEGCDNYTVSDKDVIEWVYTCDLGKDVGGE